MYFVVSSNYQMLVLTWLIETSYPLNINILVIVIRKKKGTFMRKDYFNPREYPSFYLINYDYNLSHAEVLFMNITPFPKVCFLFFYLKWL